MTNSIKNLSLATDLFTLSEMQPDKTHRLSTLDMLRGAAAFAVLLSHARAYTLKSYSELSEAGTDIGLMTSFFYAVTSLGHEAVIIFFALSGFLVGGKALRDLVSQKFSWPQYIVRRMSRLLIVLLPALVATWLFDLIGLMITGGTGYDGRFAPIFNSGPPLDGSLSLSISTFLGNLAFLQTIAVPTFGTNSPLWSLANEFWYYLIFPLIGWVVLAPASLAARLFGIALLAALSLTLPWSILSLGAIWVAGAVASIISSDARLSNFLTRTYVRVLALIVLFGGLGASKAARLNISDLELGLIVATCLPALAHMPGHGRWYQCIARSSSEISYTLYLTHFPLLSLLAFSTLAPTRLAPNIVGYGVMLGFVTLALLWAVLLYQLFESRTDRLYRAVSRLL